MIIRKAYKFRLKPSKQQVEQDRVVRPGTQKSASKKIKFSNHWKKQRGKITKLHNKIAYIRGDFLHKAASKISKNHAMIVVEDLKITNMSKSFKGTLDNPGKQIKAKSGLNRAILDQGWGEFRRQLEYKTNWLGGVFVKVPPQNTSLACQVCGYSCGQKYISGRVCRVSL